MKVKVMYDKDAYRINKAYTADAGFDIRTPEAISLPAHSSATIDTGVHICIPEGYVGFIKSKSGLNVKHDIISEGVIDANYTGSIVVKLHNYGLEDYYFNAGAKITQLVILPIPEVELEEVNSLEATERGENGFGSSGR